MLFYSSFLFSIPVVLSFYLGQLVLSSVLGALTLTSIMYHGTYHNILKIVDMSVVIPVTAFSTIHSIYGFIYYKNIVFCLAAICGTLASLIYISNTKGSDSVHLFIHLIGILGFCFYSYALSYSIS